MAKGINFNLDTTKSEFQNPMVELRQGDGNYQSLDVTVTSNGEPLDLTDWTITFMGTTNGDHKIVDSSATVENALQGIFNYTPTKAWGQDIGEFKKAYFKFSNGDKSASSADFRAVVSEAVDLTEEEAGDYISVVDQLINQVKTDMDNKLNDTNSGISEAEENLLNVKNDIKNLNDEYQDIKSSDNAWSGENKFDKIIVGNISGTADNATHANTADNATHANTADNATHANTADNATDNDASHLNESNVFNESNTFNDVTSIKEFPKNGFELRPDYYTTRETSMQDITVIGNKLYIFEGASSDHNTTQKVVIRDLSKGYSQTGGLFESATGSHNLGHVNGVDFISGQLENYISQNNSKGYLVAYNGSGLPPEITLFDSVSSDTKDFMINNGVNIVFKENGKVLLGDGSACFGGDFKKALMTRRIDEKTIGIKIINLGTGDKDFSDKTNEKNDMNHWGNFIPGKNDFQYNGTAEVEKEILLSTLTIEQNTPQGQTYKNGKLYIGVGFKDNVVLSIKIYNEFAKIENVYYYSKNINYGGEIEGVAFHGGSLITLSSPIDGETLSLLCKTNIYGSSNLVDTFSEQIVLGNKSVFQKTYFKSFSVGSDSFSVQRNGMVVIMRANITSWVSGTKSIDLTPYLTGFKNNALGATTQNSTGGQVNFWINSSSVFNFATNGSGSIFWFTSDTFDF